MVSRTPTPARAASGADAPEPPSATGQYPDDVWAERDYAALALAADAPEPPSATGQYPDDVWAEGDYAALALAADAPEPPSAPAAPPQAEAPHANAPPAGIPLDNQEAYYLIRQVAEPYSGEDLFSAVDTSAIARDGLRFGLVHFRQANGELGGLLAIMHRRDPSLFSELFRPHAAELLAVTGAATPAERLGPVGGKPLWDEEWLTRFRQAGMQEIFRSAQNEAAIEGQFRPMARAAAGLGIGSDRGLAMLYELVLAHGLDAGLTWARAALAGAEQQPEEARLTMLVSAAPPAERDRLERLRSSTAFDGTRYALTTEQAPA